MAKIRFKTKFSTFKAWEKICMKCMLGILPVMTYNKTVEKMFHTNKYFEKFSMKLQDMENLHS
jgi:hypothetical protein